MVIWLHLVTALLALGLGQADTERGYRFGRRLARPTDTGVFELSVEASRREAAGGGAPEHGVALRLGARW